MSLHDDKLIYERYTQINEAAAPATASITAYAPGTQFQYNGATYQIAPSHVPTQNGNTLTVIDTARPGQQQVFDDTGINDINANFNNLNLQVPQQNQQGQGANGADPAVKGDPEVDPDKEGAWTTPVHGAIDKAQVGSSDWITQWGQKKANQVVSALGKKGPQRSNAAVGY